MTKTMTPLIRPAADLVVVLEGLGAYPATSICCKGTHKIVCRHEQLDSDDYCLSCDEVPRFRRGVAVPHTVSCNACL